MPQESRFEGALISQIARYGLEPFLETTRTLIVLVDVEGRPLAANPAFESLRNLAGAKATLLELVNPAGRAAARTWLDASRRAQAPLRHKLELDSTGAHTEYQCLLVPVSGELSLLFAEPLLAHEGLLAVNERLSEELKVVRQALEEKTSELQAVLSQIDELAHTDSLTFLPNRKSIIASLQRYVTYAERYRTPLTVSMLDLDGFKAVNDGLGHRPGDEILGLVAKELREGIREPDEIGRYGGDEFLLVLPNTTALAASEQATRLCSRLHALALPAQAQSMDLSLSIGIAQHIPGKDTWQSLLERADRALYEAKRLGGNQWLILEA